MEISAREMYSFTLYLAGQRTEPKLEEESSWSTGLTFDIGLPYILTNTTGGTHQKDFCQAAHLSTKG